MSASSRDGLSPGRRTSGLAVAVAGPVLLTLVLLPVRDRVGIDTVLLLLMLVSVVASALGGVVSAVLATAVAAGLANFFFTKPYGSLQVASTSELIDLVIFFAVAVLVGVITEWGARARARAEGARLRAEWLAALGTRGDDADAVEVALAEARTLFSMNRVALLRADGAVLAKVGAAQADDVVLDADAGDGLRLALSGPERLGADRPLLQSLAATTGQLWRRRELGRIDEVRAGLLAAVGHDLRNPLAALTTAAETLRQPDLDLSAVDRDELLAGIGDDADRLNHIIGNLLDASRLQAGVLSAHLQATDVLEVLPEILRTGQGRLDLDLPDDLPAVRADPGLLERVLENLVANAVREAPGQQVTIAAHRQGRSVQVQVIDHGPGVSPDRFEQLFVPFQHFGDRTTSGVGLGLSIARGFTAAMDGTLTPSITPGGGLTMTVTLEVADEPVADR